MSKDIDAEAADLAEEDSGGYEIGKIVYSDDPESDYEEIDDEEENVDDEEDELIKSNESFASKKDKDDFMDDAINFDPDDPEQYWKS